VRRNICFREKSDREVKGLFLERIVNRRNQKWIDIETMQKSGLPLVMYGAGVNAVLCAKFLREHSVVPDVVCVTSKKNPDEPQLFEGIPVITLEEVGERFREFNCLIAFADIVTAKNNLERMSGVRGSFILDNPGVVEDIDYSFLKKNRTDFQKAYDLLADSKSREAFVDFLNMRISGEPDLSGITLEPQYFCDIMPLGSDEALVDCGAYDGDTIFTFIDKTGGRYDIIYAFEPDQNNFDNLMRNIESRGIKRVKMFQKGVWDKRDILKFSSTVSTASHIATDGNFQIEVDSIDNVVSEGRATIIKMDIEGAELAALKGARKVIERERPRLAISVYHKAEDLITIPVHLAELMPECRFYLRKHSCFSLETVFYAIPDKAKQDQSILSDSASGL
jgi:FkbM family methyltransferase